MGKVTTVIFEKQYDDSLKIRLVLFTLKMIYGQKTENTPT